MQSTASRRRKMPDWPNEVRAAIANLNLEPTREADVVEELSQHLRDRYEEMLAGGVDADQAYRTLRAELEDGRLPKGLASTVARAREPLAAGSSGQKKLFGGLGRDIRYAMRQLWQSPGFAVVAILSLALGVGANTAIFQLLDAVRLRLLPVQHPEQLAYVRIADSEHCCSGNFSDRTPDFTFAHWEQIRAHQQAFSGVFAWGDESFNLASGGEVRYAEGLWVSGDYFRTLGVQPFAGRLLSADDDRAGCGSPVAVVSHAFWQRELGGSPQAIGKKLPLNGLPFEVIGVAPPGFSGIYVGKS